MLITDAIYSWWTHPIAVYDGADMWVGSVGRRGVNRLHKVGATVESVDMAGPYSPDDHNGAAVAVGDLDVLVAYSRHNTDGHIRVQHVDKTTLAAGPQTQLPMGGNVAYAQLLHHGGTVHLICRVDGQDWVYRTSADSGQTWGPVRSLLDGSGYTSLIYCSTRQSGDQAYLTVSGHPASDFDEIRAAVVDLPSGQVRSVETGAVLGDLAAGPNLLPPQLDLVANPTPPDRVRLLDVATVGDAPGVVYLLWDANDPTQPPIYKCKRYAGGGYWAITSWTLAAGQTFGFTPEIHYHGGAALSDDGSTMRTSRHDGTHWLVEQWTWNGSTWVFDRQVASSQVRLIRPYAVRGGGWLHQDTYYEWIDRYYGDLVVE